MTRGNNSWNDIQAIERFSRRFQNGVEILERESHSVVRMRDSRYITLSSPRLVIVDALSAARTFISKRRSDIRGLNAILRESFDPRPHRA